MVGGMGCWFFCFTLLFFWLPVIFRALVGMLTIGGASSDVFIMRMIGLLCICGNSSFRFLMRGTPKLIKVKAIATATATYMTSP